QQAMDLSQGRLLQAAYFRMLAGEAPRLLLAIHHLAVDGVSWRILLEDLATACAQLLAGEPVELGRKTSSYKAWAEQQAAAARRLEKEEAVGFWRELLRGGVGRLPVDQPGGENRVKSVGLVERRLSREETRELMQEAARAYRAGVEEIMLAALVK